MGRLAFAKKPQAHWWRFKPRGKTWCGLYRMWCQFQEYKSTTTAQKIIYNIDSRHFEDYKPHLNTNGTARMISIVEFDRDITELDFVEMMRFLRTRAILNAHNWDLVKHSSATSNVMKRYLMDLRVKAGLPAKKEPFKKKDTHTTIENTQKNDNSE